MAVQGRAKRLYRRDITTKIAGLLGIDAPEVPPGSTVGTKFLDAVVRKFGGDPASLPTTYRKLEFALIAAGERYEGGHDSSEHLGPDGGGTVTNGGYRKLLRGVTAQPQCFILNIADHPVSKQYADVPGESYGFDDNVSGRVPFLEAGAGSRVVFYRTRKATQQPRRAFIAHAVVSEIGAVDGEGYRAELTDYQEFDLPVLAGDVAIENWNPQHGIVEIDYETLAAIVQAGTGAPVPLASQKFDTSTVQPATAPITAPVPQDVKNENEADRLLSGVPPVEASVDLSATDPLPEVLPAPGTANPLVEVVAPAGLTDDVERENTERRAARGKARQALDKYIERRAVHVAKVYLANQGWRLHRDCQKLGVGYDLEFRKGDSSLNVEVKGIQGSSLSFNMTALEWARVVNDPDFIVIAVTGVIQATTTQVHILTRDRLAAGERRVVQYRMNLL